MRCSSRANRSRRDAGCAFSAARPWKGAVLRYDANIHEWQPRAVSMPNLQPRPATAADAAGIAGCVRAAYSPWIERIGRPPGPMLDDYGEVVRDHRAYVIEGGGELIGALVLIEKEGGLLLDNVAVLPPRHGEGIGRRLLEHAESEARRLGYGHLELYTHDQMTENVAMYERIGYVVVERRIERGFPRVYMRKRL